MFKRAKASEEFIDAKFREEETRIRSVESASANVHKCCKKLIDHMDEMVKLYKKCRIQHGELDFYRYPDNKAILIYSFEAFKSMEDQSIFLQKALQKFVDDPMKRYLKIIPEVRACIKQHESLAHELEKAIQKIEKTDKPKTPADEAKYDKIIKARDTAQQAFLDSNETIPSDVATFNDSKEEFMNAVFYPTIDAELKFYGDVTQTLKGYSSQHRIDVDDMSYAKETDKIMAEVRALSIMGKK